MQKEQQQQQQKHSPQNQLPTNHFRSEEHFCTLTHYIPTNHKSIYPACTQHSTASIWPSISHTACHQGINAFTLFFRYVWPTVRSINISHSQHTNLHCLFEMNKCTWNCIGKLRGAATASIGIRISYSQLVISFINNIPYRRRAKLQMATDLSSKIEFLLLASNNNQPVPHSHSTGRRRRQ